MLTDDDGEFLPLDAEEKDRDSFWAGGESVSFSLEFEEVEEFIEEIKI